MTSRTLAIISIVLGIAGIGLAIYLSNKSNTTTSVSGLSTPTGADFGNPLTSDTGGAFTPAEQEQYKQEVAAGADVNDPTY